MGRVKELWMDEQEEEMRQVDTVARMEECERCARLCDEVASEMLMKSQTDDPLMKLAYGSAMDCAIRLSKMIRA